MKQINPFLIVSAASLLCVTAIRSQESPAPGTAWKSGHPEAGANPEALELIAGFKQRAVDLAKDKQKLRILIIGDSLSDGYHHWSHYFRVALQQAYGDGGIGSVNAGMATNPRDAIPGWLFKRGVDFDMTLSGRWREGWNSRGDIWPYLGWNGRFLASDAKDAAITLSANTASLIAVYSTGAFTTFDGKPVVNRAGGFTIDVDGKSSNVAPATNNQSLDVELARFELPQGKHEIRLNNIHDGWLWLHGFLLENATPGIVVYNISNGGWWAHNFLWRQPGFEKTLQAMKPDYIVYFLSKPESNSLDRTLADEGTEVDYARMFKRVSEAVPSARTLHILSWESKDGANTQDAESVKRRIAFFTQNKLPFLNFFEGLDRVQMAKLGWFQDSIHLTQPGGQGIGKAVSDLFLSGPTTSSANQ